MDTTSGNIIHLKNKGSGIIPVEVAPQFTIDTNGDRLVKQRTTHNTEFYASNSSSINYRMDKELLLLLWPLSYPNTTYNKHNETDKAARAYILTNLDLDAAYRRLHMLSAMAVMAIDNIKKCIFYYDYLLE